LLGDLRPFSAPPRNRFTQIAAERWLAARIAKRLAWQTRAAVPTEQPRPLKAASAITPSVTCSIPVISSPHTGFLCDACAVASDNARRLRGAR